MFAIPPSYALPVIVIVFIILMLFLYEPFRRILRPKQIAVLVFIPMLVCLPIYMMNSQEVSAYYEGDVVFRWRTWNFTIGPSDVERIDDVSNIHFKAFAYILISCQRNVTFYLVDQNRPEVHHQEANYSQDSIQFSLPYLFTEAGVAARWSVCLMNPNLEFINVSIESIWLEDYIEIAWWSIDYTLYLPLVLLFAFWVALGTSLVITHRKRLRSPEFLMGIALTILSASLGVVLSFLTWFFTSVLFPIMLFLIVQVLLLRSGMESTREQSVDIV